MRLAVRITLVCLLVAAVVALVGGLVSARLVATTAREATQRTLSDQADVLADQALDSAVGLRRVVDVLRGQGISVVVARGGRVLGGDGAAVVAARRAGLLSAAGPVHAVEGVGADALLVEVRQTPGGSFALVREAEAAQVARQQLVRNIVVALAIGVLVATAAGALLAALLSRPLRRTAGLATAMTAGRRDLRVPVEGPREVAEVASSVNGLADALQRTEARQRDFLLAVSHELRTPLTAVRGFAEGLADGVLSGDEAEEAGRVIETESQRLHQMIADLIDLARLGTDEFRLDLGPVDLHLLVVEAAEVWSARCAAAGVAFHTELPPQHPVVTGDHQRLRQVVDGLAENALRVTPRGQPVVLALRTTATTATLELRDGGPGLAPEDYPLAFDRGVLNAKYAATRPVGTGIGLALVHGLVSRMGGTTTAGPAPEGGACFTVDLPVAEPLRPPPPAR
ncbi:HAMP domain-containing sensor histidine kinase [Actinokineospora bangkokensis]|uniref:Signal transduction histidine-protein kinase/phosphatase MprB n=1 Tax=Actinokineospora bangkokensis TaxID=1193682 RepID=A0A1Q9LFK9_9PSEU|nr:HAMP domain-containing sensor histidine kinase [Actinokineospora bangkokensis]OLR90827.1 two-component sensor histidine kinase [Actinokineospora bangkokensis]